MKIPTQITLAIKGAMAGMVAAEETQLEVVVQAVAAAEAATAELAEKDLFLAVAVAETLAEMEGTVIQTAVAAAVDFSRKADRDKGADQLTLHRLQEVAVEAAMTEILQQAAVLVVALFSIRK